MTSHCQLPSKSKAKERGKGKEQANKGRVWSVVLGSRKSKKIRGGWQVDMMNMTSPPDCHFKEQAYSGCSDVAMTSHHCHLKEQAYRGSSDVVVTSHCHLLKELASD